jgi:glutaconate CoA-transferase subunit B
MSKTVELQYTSAELMTIAVARRFRNGATCFIGVGMPGAAACVARMCHAPEAVLIYESGCVGAKPSFPPLSIADDELANTSAMIVSIPEIFTYWLQGRRIDMAILGAAQIDKYGNINTTVIGDYARPDVRLPGAGGAPEIAAHAREVIVMLQHSRRAFVEKLDFVTTPGSRVTAVITDLGILEPAPITHELILVSRHAGVQPSQIAAATCWPLKMADPLEVTPDPSKEELDNLRELKLRQAGSAQSLEPRKCRHASPDFRISSARAGPLWRHGLTL